MPAQVLVQNEVAATQRAALVQATTAQQPATQHLSPATPASKDSVSLQEGVSPRHGLSWQQEGEDALVFPGDPSDGDIASGGCVNITEHQRNNLVQACLARNAQVLASLA